MAIALNWYVYPHNAARWDALASALGQGLRDEHGLDTDTNRYQGDTQALVAGRAGSEGGTDTQGERFAIAYCCGIDAFRHREQVLPVAVPVYQHSAPGGLYSSVILARRDDPLAGCSRAKLYNQIANDQVRVAVNQRMSWSGSLVIRADADAHATASALGGNDTSKLDVLWQTWPETGGHANSVQWLVEDRADAVFVDETSWAFMTQSRGHSSDDVQVIGRTVQMPRCPLVVPRADERVISAMRRILCKPTPQVHQAMTALGIESFSLNPPEFWLEPFAHAARRLGL